MMILRYLRRFPHALRGVTHAVKHDFSFRTQFFGGLAVIVAVLWYASPLTTTELLFLVLSWSLVLITELQNSAVEAALDHLHPERHHFIKISKDMAAGAVLIAGIFFGAVVLTIAFF